MDLVNDSQTLDTSGSSDEFVKDKYIVHAIPTVDTNGCNQSALDRCGDVASDTHNLIWQWYNSEIKKLDCRPDHVVGFQGGKVYVLEFPHYRSSSTAFGNGHECEEAGKS